MTGCHNIYVLPVTSFIRCFFMLKAKMLAPGCTMLYIACPMLNCVISHILYLIQNTLSLNYKSFFWGGGPQHMRTTAHWQSWQMGHDSFMYIRLYIYNRVIIIIMTGYHKIHALLHSLSLVISLFLQLP